MFWNFQLEIPQEKKKSRQVYRRGTQSVYIERERERERETGLISVNNLIVLLLLYLQSYE